MARICGKSQTEIARDIAEYEMEVERNIITPFQTVVEVRTHQFEVANEVVY